MSIPISQLPSDLVYNGQLDVSNGVKQNKYNQLNDAYNSSQGGNSSGGYQPPDYNKLAQSMLEMQQKANAPAVAQLQSTIPTTQQSYLTQGSALQSQIDPLKQRYQSALDALTAGSASDLNTAQVSASREFGARGVPLSSSAYDQYLQKQTLPISSSYAGNYGQLQGQEAQGVLGLQNQIAGLPVQSQQSVDQINQAIAALQSGGNSQAIQNALSLYQSQAQASQAAASLALQQQLGFGGLQIQQQGQNLQGSQFGLTMAQLPLQMGLLGAQTNAANAGAGASSASANLNNIQAGMYNPANVSKLLQSIGIGVPTSTGPANASSGLSGYIGK